MSGFRLLLLFEGEEDGDAPGHGRRRDLNTLYWTSSPLLSFFLCGTWYHILYGAVEQPPKHLIPFLQVAQEKRTLDRVKSKSLFPGSFLMYFASCNLFLERLFSLPEGILPLKNIRKWHKLLFIYSLLWGPREADWEQRGSEGEGLRPDQRRCCSVLSFPAGCISSRVPF